MNMLSYIRDVIGEERQNTTREIIRRREIKTRMEMQGTSNTISKIMPEVKGNLYRDANNFPIPMTTKKSDNISEVLLWSLDGKPYISKSSLRKWSNYLEESYLNLVRINNKLLEVEDKLFMSDEIVAELFLENKLDYDLHTVKNSYIGLMLVSEYLNQRCSVVLKLMSDVEYLKNNSVDSIFAV